MNPSAREVKTKVPARVVIMAALIALTVVGFVIVAVWQSGLGINSARMSGIIVSKEFQPLAQKEREITLNRSGAVSSTVKDGEYIIHVEVPQGDGRQKLFDVWMNDKQAYEAVKVGDSFDVGPYLIPAK